MLKYLTKFWWACLILFLLHQFLEKILAVHILFFDNYLDPLLAMPIILGLHLAERKYFFRAPQDFKLPIATIIIVTLFFAIIFEEGFPKWRSGFVSDPLDYLCYGLGAVAFFCFSQYSEPNT